MTEINAVEFQKFINGTHTADGSHALLRFATAQGDFTIALPDDQLGLLMAALSNVAAQNAKLKTGDNRQKHAFPCVWWNFGLDAAQTPTLTFRVAGSMELSFQTGKPSLPLMREALETMESQLPPVKG